MWSEAGAIDPNQPRPVVGNYRLLEALGSGGFGVVYLAQRLTPPAQRVALKILLPERLSADALARFDFERQALSVMDHPNIARVYDAGTTPDGRPYFVMELVRGEPITRYCDRHRLSIRDRLELFIPVCEAVQHAHYKGIVHRDLKPSNVLVSQIDDRPVPKVIDFGVAKALLPAPGLGAATAIGIPVGTIEYMSPEQAEGGRVDIDARTDVYSLGVLLYELLTGALPFDPDRLREAAYREVFRIIREEDPPTPSRRLSSLDEARARDVAQRRDARLEQIRDQLRRELEWVPLKAMRKERQARYRSPLELADDLRAYLAGRPLSAAPASAAYRARKFIRRNRVRVIAGAVAGSGVLAGLAVAGAALGRAAEAGRREAAERAYAQSFEEFLREDLVPLATPDAAGASSNVPLAESLGVAAGRLGDRFAEYPALRARLAAAIGQALVDAGLLAQAWPSVEGAVADAEAAPDLDPKVRAALALVRLSATLRGDRSAGRDPLDAVSKVRALAEELALTLGEDDALTLTVRHDLASELKHAARGVGRERGPAAAEPMLREAETLYTQVAAARGRTLGAEHEGTLTALYNLALVPLARAEILEKPAGDEGLPQREREALRVQREEELERALAALRVNFGSASRALGEASGRAIEAGSELAKTLHRLGRLSEAAEVYARVTPAMRERLGERHWRTLETVYSEANCARAMAGGETDERRRGELRRRAAELYAEFLASYESYQRGAERVFPHEQGLRAVTRLSALEREAGRTERARSILMWFYESERLAGAGDAALAQLAAALAEASSAAGDAETERIWRGMIAPASSDAGG